MGDMIDMFRDLKEMRKDRRRLLGVPCHKCNEKQPKRTPTLLMPGQRCKVDGYLDPRPREEFEI